MKFKLFLFVVGLTTALPSATFAATTTGAINATLTLTTGCLVNGQSATIDFNSVAVSNTMCASYPNASESRFSTRPRTAVFEPVWAIQNHVWTDSESWGAGGFPAGNDGTGCFVTNTGCVRS